MGGGTAGLVVEVVEEGGFGVEQVLLSRQIAGGAGGEIGDEAVCCLGFGAGFFGCDGGKDDLHGL